MSQLLLLPDKPGNTKYTPKHKLLPLRERPVERVSARADACTIVELLAAILGGPQPIETADALLAHFNGRLSDLRRAPAHEIADIPGIGQQNAARIKAAVELGLRLTLNTEEDRPTIHSPADAAAMLQHEMSDPGAGAPTGDPARHAQPGDRHRGDLPRQPELRPGAGG